MSERENKTPLAGTSRVLRCDEWEAMIADALDATLTAADAAAFTRHHSECPLCAQMLKETQQGRDWMQYLAADPEPPADLFKKILARTSQRPDSTSTPAAEPGLAAPAVPSPGHPAWNRTPRLPVSLAARQLAGHLFEPRLMMTLAMAFFSIALTLNLTGVHLTQVRPADLQPSRLRATLTRQYYSTNEQVTKYYENLRLVYEMEARVRELRRSSEAEPAPSAQPSPSPSTQTPTRQRDGTSAPRSTVPQGELPPAEGGRTQGKAVVTLPALMVDMLLEPSFQEAGSFASMRAAGFHETPHPGSHERPGERVQQVFRAFSFPTEGQAKRSLV